MKVVPMWETDNALYHFDEKERAEYLEGEKPDLKYVVVDEDFFISTWQYKDMEGIHGIFDREKEANEFAVEKFKEKYEEKIKSLLAKKEKELNVHVVSTEFDEDKNLHILCHRMTDDSFIVWSSYYTGEEKTSFVNFHNGSYDMTLEQGVRELERRSGADVDYIYLNDYLMARELTDMGYDVDLDLDNKTYNSSLVAEMAINEGYKWSDVANGWAVSVDFNKNEKEIFIGHNEVYVIEVHDFQIDAEASFFPNEYLTDEVYTVLNEHIKEHGLEPKTSDDGYITVPDDENVIIYEKDNGVIEYATAYEDDRFDKKTWKILNEFYKDSVRFWEKANIGKDSPANQALIDVSGLSRNPFSPRGERLDNFTKHTWVKGKSDEITKSSSKTVDYKNHTDMER